MNYEEEMIERGQPSQPEWFAAPDDILEPCMLCRCAILPGESITEYSIEGEDYVHKSCIEERIN